MTKDSAMMSTTFKWSTADFGAKMIAGATYCATMMTSTAFHGIADSFAKTFSIFGFETSNVEGCLTAATFCVDEDETGWTVVEVA
jgi:hypothetical protein